MNLHLRILVLLEVSVSCHPLKKQFMPALYKSLGMLGFRSEFSTILTPR